MQIERGVPGRIKIDIARRVCIYRPLFQTFEAFESPGHFVLDPDDADEVLHHFLQIALNSVRIFAALAVEWGKSGVCFLLNFVAIDGTGRIFLGKFCGVFARPFAKHDQVGKRVTAETVCTVDTGRTFARSE